MNIAIIGSGGREHALCEKILESKKVNKVVCIPGNGGTEKIAQNLKIDILDFPVVLKNIKKLKIDLVIVGPEEPLVYGIVDFLRKKKIKVFGPNKFAAKLEGSKGFMKNLCKENNIPTAGYKICKKMSDIKLFVKNNKFPIVVKADGLAAGKGVVICKNLMQLNNVSKQIFLGKFKSSKKLVLEEFIDGEEASYFLIVDKNNFSFFGTAQDHKRVGNGETGPNTGGMGAYSPAPIISKAIEKKVLNKIIKPTLNFFKRKNKHYTGFLYAGLMIKHNEPYLIEYNVRMGDPECQVILPRIKSELINIIENAVENNLKKIKINWFKKICMTVVLCSKGYPGTYKKNLIISNLEKIKNKKNVQIIHAGTLRKKKKFISNGGRVLNITALGENINEVKKKIYKLLKNINWKDGFYRTDIGWRLFKK